MNLTKNAEAPARKYAPPALPGGLKAAGMTIKHTCEYFDCGKPKIYEWIGEELLERFYVGTQVRVTVESAERLLEILKEDARERTLRPKAMSELRKRRELKRARQCNCSSADGCTGACRAK